MIVVVVVVILFTAVEAAVVAVNLIPNSGRSVSQRFHRLGTIVYKCTVNRLEYLKFCYIHKISTSISCSAIAN